MKVRSWLGTSLTPASLPKGEGRQAKSPLFWAMGTFINDKDSQCLTAPALAH